MFKHPPPIRWWKIWSASGARVKRLGSHENPSAKLKLVFLNKLITVSILVNISRSFEEKKHSNLTDDYLNSNLILIKVEHSL